MLVVQHKKDDDDYLCSYSFVSSVLADIVIYQDISEHSCRTDLLSIPSPHHLSIFLFCWVLKIE